MDTIMSLIQPYYYAFMYSRFHLYELILATLLFSSSMKRKPHFVLRLTSSFFACFFIYALLAVLRVETSPFIAHGSRLFMECLTMLLLLLFCFRETLTTTILYGCAGVAACEIGANFYSFMLYIFGITDADYAVFFQKVPIFWSTFLFFFIHFLIYMIIYILFGRYSCDDIDKSNRRKIMILAFCSIMLISFLSGTAYIYRTESIFLYTICRLYATIVCLFTLLIRSGFLTQSKNMQEIAIMEQVLDEQRKQYQSQKENIDIINMKCHDLKHQLNDLSDKLTTAELQSLQSAIEIYDKNIKTGNEILDVLLYQKSLVFDKENIKLSCMADGKLLHFIQVRHLYSLLNNALDNAHEAVQKIVDPEKKFISITITKQPADSVEISIVNYFAGYINQSENTILTSKTDTNHHGFGLMSMRYIVKQYNGTLETFINGDIFTLQITIPIPTNNENR